MRLTMIRHDAVCCIDGVCRAGIDVSSLPADVHALQWYGDHGIVERVDPDTRHYENERITSLDPYRAVIASWEAKSIMPEAT
ncbi:MAG: hypothetical protein IOC82_02730 [Aestuariivirga sp.]|uniref:hypothetical protein n=1 Tax=Aestuariivirga sp. TaxID=2650926 RepID=UPI0025BFB51A|nr:hypothetical protein [Aestuariivirga sp.]MCA3559929.1 hypothetical protein [Aestuariivirga sp.]